MRVCAIPLLLFALASAEVANTTYGPVDGDVSLNGIRYWKVRSRRLKHGCVLSPRTAAVSEGHVASG